jgi:hypothetical protein
MKRRTNRPRSVIHVEPKHPMPPYSQLPAEMQRAIARCILIAARRGRLILRGLPEVKRGNGGNDEPA